MNPPSYIEEFRTQFSGLAMQGDGQIMVDLESFITTLVEGRKAELAAKVDGMKFKRGEYDAAQDIDIHNHAVENALTLIKQS